MKKILTVILDGFGYRKEEMGNAIKDANPTNLINIWNKYPHSILKASGEEIGLKENQGGNAFIGHMTLGAGRLVKSNDKVISDFFDEDLNNNENYLNMISYLKETGGNVHLVGLLSDGCVHSNINHFTRMYEKLYDFGIKNIYFDLITDGRDTDVKVSYNYIKQIESLIKNRKGAYIGTICGRYYAMDKDSNFDRTKTFYELITKGKGVKCQNIKDMIKLCYSKKMTDEFLPPLVTMDNKKIKDGDVVIWMNYRNDRSKQILSSLCGKNFNEFDTIEMPNLKVYTFFNIDKNIKTINFMEHTLLENPLGIYLSKLGLNQARISESEKIFNITTFFDGGYTGAIEGCTKYIVDSPSVATYDMVPQMNSEEVTKKVISCLEKDYDFILVNYCNADLVSHTGNYNATIKAIQNIDECLGKIVECAEDNFYKVIIVSDHGSADEMKDEEGKSIHINTSSDVPFIILDENIKLKDKGDLTNVAPTILEYMDIAIPKEMESESIIKN